MGARHDGSLSGAGRWVQPREPEGLVFNGEREESNVPPDRVIGKLTNAGFNGSACESCALL